MRGRGTALLEKVKGGGGTKSGKVEFKTIIITKRSKQPQSRTA